MRKATLPKVERVNRLEGQGAGDFLDVMMGEVFSPWHFYIQVPTLQTVLWLSESLGCSADERFWLRETRV